VTDRLNWLQLTNEIQPAWDGIVETLGGDRVDAVCSGRWYELSHAAIARALNIALDETGLSPRKKKRIGTGMLNVMFMVIPFVFMFGWMARGDDAE
jgi:hypothetical protein